MPSPNPWNHLWSGSCVSRVKPLPLLLALCPPCMLASSKVKSLEGFFAIIPTRCRTGDEIENSQFPHCRSRQTEPCLHDPHNHSEMDCADNLHIAKDPAWTCSFQFSVVEVQLLGKEKININTLGLDGARDKPDPLSITPGTKMAVLCRVCPWDSREWPPRTIYVVCVYWLSFALQLILNSVP